MSLSLSYVVFGLVLVLDRSVFGSKAPNYISICPELTSPCLTPMIQKVLPEFAKGIPELGVESIDPLEGEGHKYEITGGLKIALKNIKVKGFRNCLVKNAQIIDSVFTSVIHCNLTIKAKYTANGRLLLLPINGDGDAKVKAVDLILNVRLNVGSFEGEDGLKYTELKDYTINHTFNDKVTFGLSNLFKGNPLISQTTLDFLNQNWKLVVDDLGSPMIDWAAHRVVDIIKVFFKNVPRQELFPPSF